jgi:sulfur carrier protein
MKIKLNGQERETKAATVAELLQELGWSPVGVAVAINQSVVTRGAHPTHQIEENDEIEIIRAVQGG